MMLKMRQLRKEAGLTMKELGMKVGALESSISTYERGIVEPDIETLGKIADALGVTIDELLGRDTDRATDQQVRIALIDGEGELTPAQYEEVKKFVRFIRERDADADK